MSDSHEKLPMLFWVQLALAAAIGVMYLVTPSTHGGEPGTSEGTTKAAKNLAPVGVVTTNTAKVAGSTKARSGEEVYTASCLACHAAGIANAPKPDDKAAWEPRVATGLDALMKTAINGKGAMPARGGNPAVTDEEIKAAILYMTEKAGFDLGSAKKQVPTSEMTATKKAVETAVSAVAVAVTPTAPAAPLAPTAPKETVAATQEEVAPAMANNDEGEKVYKAACFACHDAGVAGSPKLGDKDAWTARIALGNDVLYTSAVSGKGVMPPKGGNMGLSDDAVKAAVDYMVAVSK